MLPMARSFKQKHLLDISEMLGTVLGPGRDRADSGPCGSWHSKGGVSTPVHVGVPLAFTGNEGYRASGGKLQMCPPLDSDGLEQGAANSSCKGPDGKYFRLRKPCSVGCHDFTI